MHLEGGANLGQAANTFVCQEWDYVKDALGWQVFNEAHWTQVVARCSFIVVVGIPDVVLLMLKHQIESQRVGVYGQKSSTFHWWRWCGLSSLRQRRRRRSLKGTQPPKKKLHHQNESTGMGWDGDSFQPKFRALTGKKKPLCELSKSATTKKKRRAVSGSCFTPFISLLCCFFECFLSWPVLLTGWTYAKLISALGGLGGLSFVSWFIS